MQSFEYALSLFIIGFDGYSLPDEVAQLLGRGLGGVALFRRNIAERDQVISLCASIRRAAENLPPPLIAVDEEGGRVQRLKNICPPIPPMHDIGQKGVTAAFETGKAIGRELASLGFNVNFAPVLDVNTNPSNPIIGDRAFSDQADTVATCGVAFIKGLQSEGIIACGKHFPGHGDASMDSHLDLPVITADEETLLRRELIPFGTAILEGLKMVMTAHCVYPAVDERLPATLSRLVIEGWLRNKLGFSGVVITDDLGMKAIADRFSFEEVIELGLYAGIDIFLHCGSQGEGIALIETLQKLISNGNISKARVEEAASRVMKLRQSLSQGIR